MRSDAVPEAVTGEEVTKPFTLDEDDQGRCLFLVEYATSGDAAAATSLAAALYHFSDPERREAARRFLCSEARRRRRGADYDEGELGSMLCSTRRARP